MKEDGLTNSCDRQEKTTIPKICCLLNINQFLWREDHEQATDRECHRLCLPCPWRRLPKPEPPTTVPGISPSLHERGSCDPTYNFSVNINDGVVTHPNLVKFSELCRRIGRGSRVGDGPRQIRIRVGEADARRRPWDLERPRRTWALLGIFDRATKRPEHDARKPRRGPAERAVRGWVSNGPASPKTVPVRTCRPYLSATASATDFLRPALPVGYRWRRLRTIGQHFERDVP